jgi:hypothetical protein
MAIQVVRPTNRTEFMNKLVEPYDPKVGNPNVVFSEPTKLGQPENNRALEVSERKDWDKDFTIGIKDIDEALMYYFNNVLKLSVIQNNAKVTVPVIYGTPENWKSVQNDGYYRDENSKLMAPLLMFKRSSVSQNRNLGNKLDGNMVHNVQMFEKTFSRRNIYNNFAVLNNRSPEKKYVVTATPDYVTVEYQCIVWTYFVEQMDKLIEQLNFASRSYWGDPNRFQFYSSIDSFEDSITYNIGENRAVRSNFTISLNGYLIPDSLNRKLASPTNVYGISQVVFGLETTGDETKTGQKVKTTNGKSLAKTIVSDGINKTITQNIYLPIDAAVSAYILNNTQLVATYNSPTQVTFNKGWATAPSPLPANSLSNFVFFVNGVYVEPSSIVSFTDNFTTSTLIIDSGSLGYSFESSDLVIGVGKFNQS